ncbi:MFS transporter [Streptomyces sp. NPDC002248]
MTTTPTPQRALRLAVACCVLLLSGAFLTAGGLLTGPLHDRDGLSRSAIGGVLALTTVLYGAAAPLATGLARRTGLRPVAVVGLALAAGGALGCVPEPLGPVRFALCWGGGVGLGCGAVSTAFAADFAQRRFRTRRGLVTGVLTSAAVLGQFGLLPLLAPLASEGACGPLLYALAALGLAGALLALLGLGPDTRPVGGRQRYGGLARRPALWLLAALFAVCGASTNGVMWNHFTPAAHDHGIPVTTASALLALAGLCNVAGTIGSGWLSDRHDPRRLLTVYFAVRALSLVSLPFALGRGAGPEVAAFAVVFGLLDVATVPPVAALARTHFGCGAPFALAWVNGAHQAGAALVSWAAGGVREASGAYDLVWLGVGGLCAAAALVPFLGPLAPRTNSPHSRAICG